MSARVWQTLAAAEEPLKAEFFSLGDPGVDVALKGSLGDIPALRVLGARASTSLSGRDRRGGFFPRRYEGNDGLSTCYRLVPREREQQRTVVSMPQVLEEKVNGQSGLA